MLSLIVLGFALTMEDVVKHASGADCWMVIDGKVYDITSFVEAHPGGPAIVGGCGKDASELFHTRPMGSGTDHDQDAKDALATMLLGPLEVTPVPAAPAEASEPPGEKKHGCLLGRKGRK